MKTIMKINFILLLGLFLVNCGINLNLDYQKIGINFRDKESILRLEREPELFENWVKWEPINLLMTKEEKKIVKKEILKIEDPTERNRLSRLFINDFFWPRRDDNPYDEVNEFKESFYNRVVEAQTRFAQHEDIDYFRRCAYGKGWQTDMGIIYIVLGEPFEKQRYFVRELLAFFGGYYEDTALLPEEIEIWFYEPPPESDFRGIFQGGIVWILFEKDMGYWQFGKKICPLLFRYDYFESSFLDSYETYMRRVNQFIELVTESYVYDKDLRWEDVVSSN